MSTISIIGSGGMAAAIGSLAARAGHGVEVSSRQASKARKLAEQLGAGATVGHFGAVPSGDIVILAVPYAAVLELVQHYGQALAGKIVVDITNPVAPDMTSLVTPADSFGAKEIARAAPADARVVKAFNTLFSHVLAAGQVNGQPLDVFVAADDAPSKTIVSAFVASLGLRAIDIGNLKIARTLEHMCLLSLGLMTHGVRHTNFAIGVSLPA
jgi:predicted dinucleotide-binding enzyme